MQVGEDVDLDVEMVAPATVPCKLNLFGVSNMSTREITSFVKNTFSSVGFDPEVKVEWIDDESCNVVFTDDSFVDHILSLGTPMEGSIDHSISISVPPLNEGEESQMLSMRRSTENDSKNPARSWRDSKYYKKRLEDQGINPDTLAPVSRVILKPREGAKVSHSNKSSKVILIPRHQVNKARSAMYGDEAFSRKKERVMKKQDREGSSMVVDEEELRRRQERGKRFASHS